MCTLIRDAVGFEVRKAGKLGAPKASMSTAAILAIAIAPALNLLGGIASGVWGTANCTSVVSRLGLGILNLAVILACYEMSSLEPLGETVGVRLLQRRPAMSAISSSRSETT